ncbi:hypothetical protein [Aquimarina sediminis]|uniref:hypothetical protein n=1 Tax=Aquimarina sediminis TaxID=2070536 RepID=UPI000C9FFE3C|nr:hypothetical protein [Aquimarina sediminis]
MKIRINYIAITILMLSVMLACEKEDEVTIPQNESVTNERSDNFEIGKNYSYSRSLTIKDKRGNEVDLVIFTNTQDNAKSFNTESFEIVINNAEEVEKNTISNSIQTEILEEGDEEYGSRENLFKNSVLVYIKGTKFIDDVNSFAVYPSVFGNEEKASSGNYRHYAYAAANVIGATVTYTSETQSKEYLELDIKKKNGKYGIWSRLLGTKLYNVGNSATYCGSTVYHTMMIKVNFHKIKTGKCCYGYHYSFKTSC